MTSNYKNNEHLILKGSVRFPLHEKLEDCPDLQFRLTVDNGFESNLSYVIARISDPVVRKTMEDRVFDFKEKLINAIASLDVHLNNAMNLE